MSPIQTIPEFFAGKTVFVTGGNGFLGKVLVEKLLRSCPDVRSICVLMRDKRGKPAHERLGGILEEPLFDRLKMEQPEAIKKISVVKGDVSCLELGLTPEDRQRLIDTVDVIFHCAASVRFDDPLRDAVLLNTRSAREVCDLALRMSRLAVLVHVSTTYCNTNRKVIDEKLYPAHADWKTAIRMAEELDPRVLEVMTAKYLGDMPNTYTFTKQLAEHVVNDMCGGKVPVVVFRPSIVISSAQEPVSGWIDNFNGPVGILVASGKGILSTVYTGPDIVSDYMPVDIAVKALIAVTWKKATSTSPLSEPSFYNCSSYSVQKVTMKDMVHMGKYIVWQLPFNDQLWHVNTTVTSSELLFYLRVILFHIIPGFFIDLLLRLLGKEPMLVRLQRKIYIANVAVQYFITNQWSFLNKNTIELSDQLHPKDAESFGYNASEFNTFEYLTNAMRGARKYLLKEDESTLPQAIKHSRRMYLLHQVISFSFYILGLWLFFHKVNVPRLMYNLVT